MEHMRTFLSLSLPILAHTTQNVFTFVQDYNRTVHSPADEARKIYFLIFG